MPRRLDPEKGLPGLFARDGAAKDMEFLVRDDVKRDDGRDVREKRAKKTASRKLKRPRAGRPKPQQIDETPIAPPTVASAPVARTIAISEEPGATTPIPVRTHVRVIEETSRVEPVTVNVLDGAMRANAPPPRRVPELRPDDALSWREVPSLVACLVGWGVSALRTGR